MNHYKKYYTIIIALVFLNCVQETHTKTITIMVDMNAMDNPSEVGIRGSYPPLSWNRSLLMQDDNNDGIYETTFEMNTANYDVEFKFVNNDSIFELKNQANRNLTFDYKPETILYRAVFDNIDKVNITNNQ